MRLGRAYQPRRQYVSTARLERAGPSKIVCSAGRNRSHSSRQPETWSGTPHTDSCLQLLQICSHCTYSHILPVVEPGLRERKRTATRQAIERAALVAVDRVGYEHATAEAIAAEAGVSERTFFNYFPVKDEAIVGTGPVAVPADEAAAVLREHVPRLLEGISTLITASFRHEAPDPELMSTRRMLLEAHPALLQRHLASIDRFEAELAGVVVAHLNEDKSRRRLAGRLSVEDEAWLAVTTVGTAVRFNIRSWATGRTDKFPDPVRIHDTITSMAELHGDAR